MEEYSVKVTDKKGSIVFENFDEIKAALAEQMNIYNSLEITEEGKQEAKKDVATLRKIKKAIDDRRKEIKNSFMDPYTDFEKQVKELTALIDAPIAMISGNLDAFEQKRIAEKKQHIVDLWNDNIKIPGADISVFYNPAWENSTTTDASIKNDISQYNITYESNLNVLKSFEDVGEVEIEKATKIFVSSKLDITKAVAEINHFREAKKMMEEQQRRDEERRAEQERLRAEREAEQEKLRIEREAEQERLNAEREKEMLERESETPEVIIPDPVSKETHIFSMKLSSDEYEMVMDFLIANGLESEEI